MSFENDTVKKLKSMANSLGTIRDTCITNATINLDKIEDEKQRLFMKSSLENAINGELTSEEFIENLKNI